MTNQTSHESLLKWSNAKGRLPWQQHALWLIVTGVPIDDLNVGSLVAIALQNFGWKIRSGIDSQKIESKDFDLNASENPPIILKELCHVAGLNALDDNQLLHFNTDGLTIVYGPNGSGKSGYIRALKSISHFRGPAPSLIPNIHKTSPASPMIHIKYTVGSSEESITYDLPIDPEDALPNLRVFDEYVGQSLLGTKNEVIYLPPYVRIFSELSALFEKVEAELKNQNIELDTFVDGLPSELGEGALGQLLSQLDSSADLKLITTLAGHSEIEKKRFEELDPEFSITSTQTRSARIRSIAGQRDLLHEYTESLRQFEITVSDAQLESLKQKFLSAKKANSEIDISGTEISSLPLGGINAVEWTELWSSARKFSDVAYPAEPFPVKGIRRHCLLCMQQLGSVGAHNLQILSEFSSSVMKKRADELVTEYNDARRTIQDDSRKFSIPTTLRSELSGRKTDFDDLTKYDRELRNRATAIPDISEEKWPEFSPLPSFDTDTLVQKSSALGSRLNLIVSIANSSQKDNVRAEYIELSLKHWASKNIGIIERTITNRQRSKIIDEAITSANTNSVSRAVSAFAKRFTEKQLFDNLRTRLDDLDFHALHIEPILEGRKGALSQRMVLAEGTGVKLGEIASEGEFRAMGVAAFLAEISMDPRCGAVVFDDPVRSLDSKYRRKMAELLVKQSLERQVIVFTHDLVFLNELRRQCDQQSVGVIAQSLSSQNTSKGIVSRTMPWEDNTVKSRLGLLRQKVQNFNSEHGGKSDEERHFALAVMYSMLREIWEDAVEQVLLNGVITRFDPAIQTTRLRKLHDIEQTDLDEIETGMTNCSALMLGHSTPGAVGAQAVDMAEIKVEIDRVDTLRKKIIARR